MRMTVPGRGWYAATMVVTSDINYMTRYKARPTPGAARPRPRPCVARPSPMPQVGKPRPRPKFWH